MTNYYRYIVAILFNPMTLMGAVFYAALIILLGWLLGRVTRIAVHRSLERADKRGLDSTSIHFLGQIARVLVYIFAFLCYVWIIPSLHSLGTAWLASLGIVSVVVGMAAQSTLSNLIAGIALVLYRPFRIGHRIQVLAPTGTEIGTVERIDLGYTTIRMDDDRRLILPNSVIANQASINFSRVAAQEKKRD